MTEAIKIQSIREQRKTVQTTEKSAGSAKTGELSANELVLDQELLRLMKAL